MRFLVAITAALLFSASAFAQQSTPPADQAPPPSAGAPADQQPTPGMARPGRAGARSPNARRTACMDKARQQGLRGPQMHDAIRLCIDEARLSCTKQAIEKKIPAQQRREFMQSCAG